VPGYFRRVFVVFAANPASRTLREPSAESYLPRALIPPNESDILTRVIVHASICSIRVSSSMGIPRVNSRVSSIHVGPLSRAIRAVGSDSPRFDSRVIRFQNSRDVKDVTRSFSILFFPKVDLVEGTIATIGLVLALSVSTNNVQHSSFLCPFLSKFMIRFSPSFLLLSLSLSLSLSLRSNDSSRGTTASSPGLSLSHALHPPPHHHRYDLISSRARSGCVRDDLSSRRFGLFVASFLLFHPHVSYASPTGRQAGRSSRQVDPVA